MMTEVWVAVGVAAFVLIVFMAAVFGSQGTRLPRSIEVKIDKLSRRVDDVEKSASEAQHDIRNVRMSVSGLATKESVHLVATQVAEMRGEMKGVVQNTATTSSSIERIEGFLMKAAADAIAGGKPTDPPEDHRPSEPRR